MIYQECTPKQGGTVLKFTLFYRKIYKIKRMLTKLNIYVKIEMIVIINKKKFQKLKFIPKKSNDLIPILLENQ